MITIKSPRGPRLMATVDDTGDGFEVVFYARRDATGLGPRRIISRETFHHTPWHVLVDGVHDIMRDHVR